MNQNPHITANSTEYSMTVRTIESFDLECYIFKNSTEPVLFVKNRLSNTYHNVGFFFRICWDKDDIKTDLLPGICKILNGEENSEIFSSELLSALVEADFTYFSAKNYFKQGKIDATMNKDNLLRTNDFKKITMEWLAFLESL
jgi:hypothetical protein